MSAKADMCSAKKVCPLCANSGPRHLYSITSSAAASSDGGIVRPSALAVLRLTRSSNSGGLHHGQVGRLLALENPPDVETGLAIGIRICCGPYAHQAAGVDVLARRVARGDRMASRHRDDSLPTVNHEPAGTDEQRTSPACGERCKCGLDIAVAGDIENDESQPDHLRRGLYRPFAPPRYATYSDLRARQLSLRRNELTQQFQSFRRRAHGREIDHTSDITARPRRALVTRPSLTGSLPLVKTIGTVAVAALAASAASVFPTITATGWRIKSATSAGNRSS